jgi:hypothetical protein
MAIAQDRLRHRVQIAVELGDDKIEPLLLPGDKGGGGACFRLRPLRFCSFPLVRPDWSAFGLRAALSRGDGDAIDPGRVKTRFAL